VPQPPGGGFDLVGRVMADKSRLSGVPGAGKTAPARGTVVGTDARQSCAGRLHPGVGALPEHRLSIPGSTRCCPYDSLRDFVPVGLA